LRLFHREVFAALVAGASASAAAFFLTWRFLLRRCLSRAWRLLGGSDFGGRAEVVPVPVRRNEKGQALIELALVLPLILVFIMVIVDFGIALDRREVIQHAVREGARRAAVGAGTANVVDYTVDQSQGALEAGRIDVCYVDENGNNPLGYAGDGVRVSATYTYEFTIGGGEMLGMWDVPAPTIDMTPSAQARLEKFVPGATAC
jgi:TadE-like protein